MYKLYLTLLVMVCCVTISFTQTCPTSDLLLETQADIDNFATDYPDCTTTAFNVTISGSDISDLSGLSQLEVIQGNLFFNLNSVLTNLSGLENLTTIAGNCSFFRNDLLENTAALQGLITIGGYLHVFDNDALTELSGFDNLLSIGNQFLVDGNLLLQSVSGFTSLNSLGSYLSIINNPALQDLSGLNNLNTIDGFLKIVNNASLENLTALSNLTGINGYIEVIENGRLISLKGLEQIDPVTISNLEITGNSRLMVCEVASICSYLGSGGTRLIDTNGCGCNLEADVLSFCEDVCTNSGYTFTSQTEIDNFAIDNPTCRRIYGDVIIEETIEGDINNFNGLANVGSIIGKLQIKNNTTPTNLVGLDSLLAIAGDFSLEGNASLLTTDGLGMLKLIYGGIDVLNNPQLNSLSALSNLTEIDGDLLIENNAALTTLQGLGNIDPAGISELMVQNNTTLSTCAIVSVCGYLDLNQTATFGTNGIDCNSISSVETACSALPVELIYFTAQKVGSVIQLDWQTASEENNAGFEIHKSSNGYDWEIIGWMDGRGTTQLLQNYEFADRSPFVGDNYYRLKQIDFDGRFEFSNIVNVKGEALDIAIQVIPNPSPGDLEITVANPNNSKMLVTLFNSRGEIVYRSQLLDNELVWRESFVLKEAGLYFLSVQVGKAVFSEKVLVARE